MIKLTDILELELAITRASITKREIAKQLNISETALYNKLRNAAEFKASEIEKLKNILNLSESERNKIFFGVRVDEKSTKTA